MSKFIQIRNFVILSLLIVSFSCKKETTSSSDPNMTSNQEKTTITKKDIESLTYTEYVLSASGENTTANWLKFQELNTHIDLLKKADYSFFSEDHELLKTFVVELSESLPERLNESSIVARLLALETSMYKLHDESIFNANDTPQLLDAIKGVLLGYSNLVFQINKKLEKDDLKIERPQ